MLKCNAKRKKRKWTIYHNSLVGLLSTFFQAMSQSSFNQKSLIAEINFSQYSFEVKETNQYDDDLPASVYFLRLQNNSLQKVITIIKTSQ